MTFALLLYTLLLFAGLVIAEELFHRYARFSLVFFSVASVVLFSCWILLLGVADWFPWVKVLSIASGITVLSLLRTTKLGSNAKLVQWTTYAFLAVNILEATVRDAVVGNIANYLNAVAGFLLIVTLEKIRTIHINKKNEHRDLYWGGMTLSWIIGYTLWNWMFVYLNFGLQSSMAHVAVLGSALVVVLRDKERWLQARAFTLGMFFILFHSFPHLNPDILIDRSSTQFGLSLSLIPFVFMVAYTVSFVHRTRSSTPH